MFDVNFFPTPREVVMQMISGVDLSGKVVLEPSAGSGNIIGILKELGANVLACEKHPDLAKIASAKADRFLGYDFLELQAEPISHIDLIIMNPPFSNADKHIQHAWDIAPEGCHIIALCNIETVKNDYTTSRQVLKQAISKYGSWTSIGNAFSTAERKTDVEISLINLFKPKTGDSEFEDYFFDMNEEQEDAVNGSGILKHNDIREIVNRYVTAVKMFDSVMDSNMAINSLIAPISTGLNIQFGAHNSGDRYTSVISRDAFKKELQKSSWKSVFAKMRMEKYVTKGVMSDINKFVEQQQQVPFTMTNIFKMLEIIFGTHAGRMEQVLVEAFDTICSYSADNSEAGEKWKTNSNYKVNRRFITPRGCDYDHRWPSENVKISVHYYNMMEDIVKALCYLTGTNYDEAMETTYKTRYNSNNSLHSFFSHNDTPWGAWVVWNKFFRVRGYKKGTLHFEFIDEPVWAEFNLRVAKIKGWQLPAKTDKKYKGTERAKKEGVEIYEAKLF